MRSEHGEIMQFLLHFRERFSSEEEFRVFLVEEVRRFVKDARAYGIVISILPECLTPRSAFVGEGRHRF
ncbi:MAG: hypothetical protein N0A16_05545 [Blastocatellia bacterium]|nr:hypothetical protein [Blastocatellia bacterium]MCS7157172.1 hypothetical protein [Blastocatellia bacterium]MCX7752365.1 hypothetical protein [Blastocatellia bacterium]MDW8167246.1 hypothetical protein [Acidobacteriota bacterium]